MKIETMYAEENNSTKKRTIKQQNVHINIEYRYD